ncbi:biopolymer transporter ExbD [Planctomycetota bacterium]|nr:biopolymer transporter ExbD [Planctomycetota bacterium]
MSEPTEPTSNPQALSTMPPVAIDKVAHKSVRKRRALPPAKMQLQITPLIDVIFQLLIYFMVTATFVVGEGSLTANLPHGGEQATSKAMHPEQPLNIVLKPVGYSDVSIHIATYKVTDSFVDLQLHLETLQYAPDLGRRGFYKPDNPVIIKPQGEVRWQHVLNAFNAAIAKGYTNVSFAKNQKP